MIVGFLICLKSCHWSDFSYPLLSLVGVDYALFPSLGWGCVYLADESKLENSLRLSIKWNSTRWALYFSFVRKDINILEMVCNYNWYIATKLHVRLHISCVDTKNSYKWYFCMFQLGLFHLQKTHDYLPLKQGPSLSNF